MFDRSLVAPAGLSPLTLWVTAGAAALGTLWVYWNYTHPEEPSSVVEVEPQIVPEPPAVPEVKAVISEDMLADYRRRYRKAIHRGNTAELKSLFAEGGLLREPASHRYEVKQAEPQSDGLEYLLSQQEICDAEHVDGLSCVLSGDDSLTRQQRQAVVTVLLENKADVNQTYPVQESYSPTDPLEGFFNGQQSVLIRAILSQKHYLVPTLLEAKADPHYYYPNQGSALLHQHYMTPLSIACLLCCHSNSSKNIDLLQVISLLVNARTDVAHAQEQMQILYEDILKRYPKNLIEYKAPHPIYETLFPRMAISKSLPPIYSGNWIWDIEQVSLFSISYLYSALEASLLTLTVFESFNLLPVPGLIYIILDYLNDRPLRRRNSVMPYIGHTFQGQFLPDFSCYTMHIPAAVQEPEDQVCGYHKLKNLLLLTCFFKTYQYGIILMMKENGEDSWFAKIFDYCSKTRRRTAEGQLDLSYHDGFDFLQHVFSGKVTEAKLGIPPSRSIELHQLVLKKNVLSAFTAIRIADDENVPLGGAMGGEGLLVAANLARLALTPQRIEHPFALDMKEHSFTTFVIKEQKNYFIAYADSLAENKNLSQVIRRILQALHLTPAELEAYMRDIYENHSDIAKCLDEQQPKNSSHLEIYLGLCQQFLHFFRTYSEFFAPKPGAESFFYSELLTQARKIKDCLHDYCYSTHSNLPDEIVQQSFDVLRRVDKLIPSRVSPMKLGLFKKSSPSTARPRDEDERPQPVL